MFLNLKLETSSFIDGKAFQINLLLLKTQQMFNKLFLK